MEIKDQEELKVQKENADQEAHMDHKDQRVRPDLKETEDKKVQLDQEELQE